MPYEQKLLVGLDEVRSLCLQCKKCAAKLSISPDSALTVPARCFQCHADWIKETRPETYLGQLMAEEQTTLTKFLKSFAAMRVPDVSNALGFRILLELDYPKP